MIAELAQFALCLALVLSLVQAGSVFVVMRGAAAEMSAPVARLARAQFVLVLGAFVALVWLYLVSDFTVRNVFENSHSDKPWLYRVSGTWGNHEGSMLLWIAILSGFGVLLSFSKPPGLSRLITIALAVQGSLCAAFLAFIIFTSNPFWRLFPPPFEGQDLNPVLQDPFLAIHPPMLYVGYVGFSITFALAVAALIDGRINAAFGRIIRIWALWAWVFLTAGIALGSYWAYYELGWGGYWFWDPVENASLLPWLAGTALLHSAIVLERREALKAWTVLLALLAFAMSLLGTFLVRSGVLTSVHAFASDPARGLVILAMFGAFVGGGFALFAWRAPGFDPGGMFRPVSREGALVANNLLLSTAAVIVLVGTLYPIFLSAVSDHMISVGPPYYNFTVGVISAPLIALMPFGPRLGWKRADMVAAFTKLWVALGLTFLIVAAVWLTKSSINPAVLLTIGGGVWLVFGALADIHARVGVSLASPPIYLQRLARLPRAAFGGGAAHAGLGVLLLGISVSSAYKSEELAIMAPGDAVSVGPFELVLNQVSALDGPNYSGLSANFSANKTGRDIEIVSERRTYEARGVGTTEVGILRDGLSQLYVVIGDQQGGGWGVHAYYNSYIMLIWIGPLLMCLGGLLSLSDVRLRIGALGIRRRAVPAPAAKTV